MEIRKAKLPDAENLALLYLQFWESIKNNDPLLRLAKKPTLKIEIEQAKKDIRNKNTYVFVAVDAKQIIGFIELLIKKNDPMFKIKEYGYLNSCVVDKKFRRSGIARELLEFSIAFFKKKKLKYIKLNVHKINKAAISVWKKLSFIELSKLMLMKI